MRFVYAAIIWCFLTSWLTASDTVFITRVSNNDFVDGVPAKIDVDITYSLESQSQGVLTLGFNELNPGWSSVKVRLPIVRGAATRTVHVDVKPRIWSSAISFEATAGIECSAESGAKYWIAAVDHKILPVRAGPVSEKNEEENAKPRATVIDGISIISVIPDHLKEGEETDVTVKVRYELVSRDRGEINLGFNRGAGNGYTVDSRKIIESGVGEISMTARVKGAKTGDLPLMKACVNLSEYPHRPTWSPLADSSAEIEVE